jgi:hypothetical protein
MLCDAAPMMARASDDHIILIKEAVLRAPALAFAEADPCSDRISTPNDRRMEK